MFRILLEANAIYMKKYYIIFLNMFLYTYVSTFFKIRHRSLCNVHGHQYMYYLPT